ncbi:MAG: hypothetical protein HZA53_00990 [Planctomycetes bacterium]|nr:hypothetical protein [Planctomycetota bacterium]
MADEQLYAAALALADLAPTGPGGPSTLALAGGDLALLVGVVGGGLLATWIALRLVLKETAEFSRHFPRDDAAPSAPAAIESGDPASREAVFARVALPSRAHEGHTHATACGEPGLHLHDDGCLHSDSIDLGGDAQDPTD